MASQNSDPHVADAALPDRAPDLRVSKVVVMGGPAAGKATFIGSVCDEPARRLVVDQSLGDSAPRPDGNDPAQLISVPFGRVMVGPAWYLYLVGAPALKLSSALWEDFSIGAVGCVVIIDTMRLGECFDAVTYCEEKGVPYAAAINCFQGVLMHDLEQVTKALDLPPEVPIFRTDVRSKGAAKQALANLFEHVLRSQTQSAPTTAQSG